MFFRVPKPISLETVLPAADKLAHLQPLIPSLRFQADAFALQMNYFLATLRINPTLLFDAILSFQ